MERIHTRLRSDIISGDYEPGAVLSQVQLARSFGVSRTPLREAMRRLEAEGLIESLQNQRARVATIDAESLDVMFTERIWSRAMGVKVTVPFLSEIDLNGLLAATAALRIALERGTPSAANRARRALHLLYVARAGKRLRSTIADSFDSCERYRRLYVALTSGVSDDYSAIASACVRRDVDDASRLIGRLEARLAGAVLLHVSKTYKPTAICTALQMLEAAGTTH